MASYVDDFDAEESAIEQGLGLLQAIYVNKLEVQNGNSNEPVTLSVTLHPSTADNADLQYAYLTLILTLTSEYPDEVPDITIKNPRGISDEQLNSISSQLQQLASEQKGSAMLYELIEVAKEALTHNNTPYGQCVICMEDFKEGEAFTKTACYHHFHSDCLARYIQHALEEQQDQEEKAKQNGNPKGNDKQEVVCAVCREPIAYDLQQLCSVPSRKSADVKYKPDHDMQQLQKKMAALYQKQKEKGGIIDVEAENNKFLIDISVTPTLPMSTVIGSANSDEKARRTGSQEKLDKDGEKTTTDKPKDRRSQPRYNSSDKRSADKEKRGEGGRGGGGSYDRSYGERRGGRGRGGSRASSGRYNDREYYKSDRSNWRDGDRRANRRDEKGGREAKNATEAKDGERPTYKERSNWKDDDRKSNRRDERESRDTSEIKDGDKLSDRDSATRQHGRNDPETKGSLKEGNREELSSTKNNDIVERTDGEREMKGKDPNGRSEEDSRYKSDRSSSGRPSSASGGRSDRRDNRQERYQHPSGRSEGDSRRSSGKPSSASGGRPDRRDNRQERYRDQSGRSEGDSRRSSGQADRGVSRKPSSASSGRQDRRENRYQENDRPRSSNARDGHGRNQDSNRASDGRPDRRENRNQERNDRPRSSHPGDGHGTSRDTDSTSSGRPDRKENRKDRYQQRNDRPRSSNAQDGQGRNRELEREDRPSKRFSPRDERSSATKSETIPSRDDRKDGENDGGRRQRRDRPRSDAERNDGDQRWKDDSPRSNPRQRRDKDHPKKGMDSNRERPRNQESRSDAEIQKSKSETNDKSHSDSKHTRKTDSGHPKSGNHRYDVPKTRNNDVRRTEESQDQDWSNNSGKVEAESDRSLIDRITSSKGGQRNRNNDRSSNSAGRGRGRLRKDRAARQEHTSSDKETKQTKPPPGFEPVANEVKAPPGFEPVASESKREKVKPPPGFEDFR